MPTSTSTFPILFLLVVLATVRLAVAQSDTTDERLKSLERYALTHPGDPARGRELFAREKITKCLICHRIADRGGQVGPDLSRIGGKFDRPHLIESLLEPSRQIVEGYRPSVILLSSGKTVTGIVKERTERDLTLLDSEGRKQTIATADIEERAESDVSLMPAGLEQELSPEELTDLIAYMETLRSGGSDKYGAAIAGPIRVPEGFEVSTVATGLDGATAIEVAEDGRLFLCEQTGSVRIIENGRLLDAPFVTLPVDANWERGVIGVTLDPAFSQEPYVYVCWVAREPYPHHRVSRFRAEGNVAAAGSEEVLLTGDDQTTMGGKVPNGHQGGALHFGNDGCLYVGIGEQTAGEPAQRLDTLLGKMLRINRDGSIPTDNPFLDRTSGKYQAIWAFGCRNPFTFAVRKSDGLMLINDVGGKFEEINVGTAGANFGWPTVDHGPRDSDGPYAGPIHWYPQASIAGGDFAPDTVSEYAGRYFFADFVHGWIRTIDPDDPAEPVDFATGLRRPVDLRFAGDGSLYVLLRNAWVIDGKFEAGTGSLLRIAKTPANAKRAAADSATDVRLDRNAIDESAGNLSAYRITTPAATYYLEKTGAGLSSLIDRDGRDWLNFHPEPGSGASGEYRGFPNAVHKQAGSYFHAMNSGTGISTTRVTHEGHDRVTIEAESGNRLWACKYDFTPEHATFTMTRMPADKHFWVLYEGTPGGAYDDDDWWMTSAMNEPQPLTQPHDGDIPAPEWIAFGDRDLNRALVLLHHEDDAHPDRFYQMQHQMTVFGFGRSGIDKHLDNVPQRVTIGFVESKQHDDVRQQVSRWSESSRR